MQIANIMILAIFLLFALLLKSELVPNDDEKSDILFRCEGLSGLSAFFFFIISLLSKIYQNNVVPVNPTNPREIMPT